MSDMSRQARDDALDNLRAIMMWLGIVIHVSMFYLTFGSPHMPLRDDTNSPLADFLVGAIHSFRMPVFFMLAGYLAAMLLEKRGWREFLRHRAMRLALPLALFWPFVYVATGFGLLLYLNRTVTGRWAFDTALVPPELDRTGLKAFHLWFLWMLWWFSVATALLSRLPRTPFVAAGRGIAWLGRVWWGFALLAIPSLIAGWGYPYGMMQTTSAFLMPWQEWLQNASYYVFGLALWTHRASLLAHYRQHWRRYAIAGLVLLVIFGAAHRRGGPAWLTSVSYNTLAWLWGFAWIGAAQVLLNRRHAVLRYLADSAYWVYLVHLPMAVWIAALLYQQPLSAVAKMLVGFAITTVLCLGSYQLLVRHTWVSVLLNGKRHPRRGGPPVTPAAVTG